MKQTYTNLTVHTSGLKPDHISVLITTDTPETKVPQTVVSCQTKFPTHSSQFDCDTYAFIFGLIKVGELLHKTCESTPKDTTITLSSLSLFKFLDKSDTLPTSSDELCMIAMAKSNLTYLSYVFKVHPKITMQSRRLNLAHNLLLNSIPRTSD